MSQVLQKYKIQTNIHLHKNIRFRTDLTYGEKMFFAEVNSMPKCPFSARKLGEFFGVSHQTILNWVKKLVDLDLLEVGIDYKCKECRQFLKAKQQ